MELIQGCNGHHEWKMDSTRVLQGYDGAGARLCPVCRDVLDDVLGTPFGTPGSPDFHFTHCSFSFHKYKIVV